MSIVALNGIYDILCSFSILLLSCCCWKIPISSHLSMLHLNMFEKEEHRSNPVIQRILAYWILTYGIVRLAAGICKDMDSNNNNNISVCILAAITYFIEAFCFLCEILLLERTMIIPKVIFVSTFSIILGATIFFYYYYYYYSFNNSILSPEP